MPYRHLLSSLLLAFAVSSHAAPTNEARVGAYFTQWGIYDTHYSLRKLVDSGGDKQLTFLDYAFGNVYANGQCGMVTHPKSSGEDGGGDAYADYQMPYPAADAVDGLADTPDTALRGHFGQLRKLKARDPGLKVMISVGGWAWSRHFSSAAASDASRQRLVSSCIDLYIKGNLPREHGAGGPGSAAGVFDGIDIDWEFPGGGGAEGNEASPDDKHHFTLLLAEFRRQLDALGALAHRHYYLSAAINVSAKHIAETEPADYSQSLDWLNTMTYDFHGPWENTANFAAPLYHDPADPGPATTVLYDDYDGIQALLAAGVPRSKINLGISFFGYGWQGVPDGGTHGLYQTASGPAKGDFEAGTASYATLKARPGPRYDNRAAHSRWTYDGKEFWTYDDPSTIADKVDFSQAQQLGGLFAWSLDGDDAAGSLLAAMTRFRQ